MQNRKLKDKLDIKCGLYFVNEIFLFVKEYINWLIIAIFQFYLKKKRINKLCQLIFIFCGGVIMK